MIIGLIISKNKIKNVGKKATLKILPMVNEPNVESHNKNRQSFMIIRTTFCRRVTRAATLKILPMINEPNVGGERKVSPALFLI